jgi:hypothetical protein
MNNIDFLNADSKSTAVKLFKRLQKQVREQELWWLYYVTERMG